MTETLAAQILVSKELICTFLGILIWDTVATLPSERRHIHQQKRSLLKVSYLINRYWSIIAQTITAVLILSRVPTTACNRIFWIVLFDGVSITVLCDFILGIRVWAVWEKSRKIGGLLLAYLCIELMIMVFCSRRLNPVSFPTELANAVNFHGCTAGNAKTAHRQAIALLYFTPTLLFNGMCLALLFWKHVRLSRTSSKLPIMQRLLRDGSFYFFVIFVTDVPNMVFCALVGHPGLDSIFVYPSITIKSLMTSRLVLSLLEAGSTGQINNNDSEKKRATFLPLDALPPWWEPSNMVTPALSAQQRSRLAQRRQTLPNLNSTFSFSNAKERQRDQGSFLQVRVKGSDAVDSLLQVPSKAVSSYSVSSSSTSSSGSGGGISWASSFAPTLVPPESSSSTVRVEASSETLVSRERRSDSLPEGKV